jgi:hypothetical protein
MTTAIKIINRAAQKATIKSAGNDLPPEEIADFLDLLNDIIKEWTSNSILKGVECTYDANTDLMEPQYATPALKATLALRACTEFEKPISQALAAEVTSTFSSMLIAKPSVPVTFPDTLPMGSGNYEPGCDDFFPTNIKDNF